MKGLIVNLKRAVLFLIIDTVLLSFVKRGREKCIVIVAVDLLGDYIISRRFLEAARALALEQDAKLIFCGSDQIKDFILFYDKQIFDEFIWTSRSGLNTFNERYSVLQLLKKLGGQVALSLQRDSFLNDALVFATRARRRIGTRVKSSIYDLFYTELVLYNKTEAFEFLRYRKLFSGLNPQLDLPANTRLTAKETALPSFPHHPFVLLLPGASDSFREWPAERFAEVACHLHHTRGLSVVVAGTKADEIKASEIQYILAKSKIGLLNLCGVLNLPQLTYLASKCTIGITNDSGGIHLLAALERLGVAASNGFNFGRFHPYPLELGATVCFVYPESFYQLGPTEHCEFSSKNISYAISDVSTSSVIDAADTLLDNKPYRKDIDLLLAKIG